MINLKSLSLRYSYVKDILSLYHYKNLHKLNLQQCYLKFIPKNLSNINFLKIDDCKKLKFIPKSLLNLKILIKNINKNKFKELSYNLKYLSLSSIKINYIPNYLYKLKTLKLYDSKIIEIPDTFII